MSPRICQCCGGRMTQAMSSNPNMCPDCERLTFDESPMLAVSTAPEAPAREVWVVPQKTSAPAEPLVAATHMV